jgi:hypothetical protein
MLVDISGRVLLEGRIERPFLQIPTASLVTGRYEFKLQANGRVVTEPLIISE